MHVDANARHNLLRPETVESLFIMFRITRDPIYRSVTVALLSLVLFHMLFCRRCYVGIGATGFLKHSGSMLASLLEVTRRYEMYKMPGMSMYQLPIFSIAVPRSHQLPSGCVQGLI